jgi:hypothetical protein
MNTDPANTRALGMCRWNTESSTTPTATPHPRAKMNRPNPAVPAPSTWLENTGPRGTSIPPPISPVASPTFTARTTGLMKMNDQPSFSSRKAWPKSIRPSCLSGRFSILGSTSREIMKAETRKVRAST